VYEHAELRARLPHRHPILLVDRVLTCRSQRIVTSKAISGSEPCFAGLSDDLPSRAYAYPPVLLLESFAQSGALLWAFEARADDSAGILALGAARKVRFHESVFPGDVVHNSVQIDRIVGTNALLSGQITCNERLVATIGSLIAVVRDRDTLKPRTAAP
jgi:3-hydroxyacyl-[acyl-carrier-protein] dehydratase